MSMEVFLIVREFETNNEVKRLGPMTERKAEIVTLGLLRNMDTENFYVDEEEAP